MALNTLGDIADSGTLLIDTTATVNGATNASTSVTISATNTNLFVGQVVTGPGVQQANGIVSQTTITAISVSGLVLTLSNPATFVNGAVLTFSSPYAQVTTAVLNGTTTASTAVTLSAANANIVAGQLVSGAGITAGTFVSSISSTSLVLTAPFTITSGTTLTFWTLASSNVSVDLAWGNFPMQPNDDRVAAGVANIGGAGVQSAYVTGASKPSTGTILFTTNAVHGLQVGDVVSTGSYATAGTPFGSALTTVSNTAGTTTFIYTNSPTVVPQVGMVLVKTAGTGAFAPNGNTILTVDTTNKTFTVAVAPTTDFSGATVQSAGQPVYSTTATISGGTLDATLLTNSCTTGTHFIAPGSPVILSSTTPAGYGTSPNGAYTSLGSASKTNIKLSSQSVSFTTNNIGSKDVTVSSLAALTAGTVTYYPYDVSEVKVIAVPSTTTFVVASSIGWSGDSTDTGVAAQSSLVGSLALVADRNWSDTTKSSSSRLNQGSVVSTVNGVNYVTPTADGIATASYYTYPNLIPGKFTVTGATVCADAAGTPNLYVWYTAYNNLAAGSSVTVTGLSNPAFNVVGASVIAASTTGFLIANPSTTGTVSGATSASSTVTLAAANGAIKVGMNVTGTNISGVVTVVAVVNTVVTLSSAQSLSNSDTLTFRIVNGTTIAGNGVAAQANFGVGNAIVTAVSGNGTTVTYTSQNTFVTGDSVNITGLTNGVFNLSAATVASANATTFTVTSAVGSGVSLTGQVGKAEYAAALTNVDGGFVAGVYYPQVPVIIGQTVAAATDSIRDRGFTGSFTAATPAITSTITLSKAQRTAGTNVAILTGTQAITDIVASGSANAVTRASGTAIAAVKVGQTVASTTITPARNITAVNYSTGVITFDGAAVGTVTSETLTIGGHGLQTGDVIVISSTDATVNGDATVIRIDALNFAIVTPVTTVLAATSGSVVGKSGTVHYQSVAAGTQSTAANAALTYTLWA
jgi:hypothetical protein